MAIVSVIVPLHNSEKYLKECLESILCQTLNDIEIICIDSSTDSTKKILENYRKSDSRIRIIEDKNSSYGHKINIGIFNAKGKYISIVESDDYIEREMLETLYLTAEEKKVDFVKSDYKIFFDTNKDRKFKNCNRLSRNEDYEKVIFLNEEKDNRFFVGYNIWTGLYNKEFLQNNKIKLNDSPGASYQDAGFSILVCLFADKICFIPKCYYNYRIDNMDSSAKSKEKYAAIVYEFHWIENEAKKRNILEDEKKIFISKMKIYSYFWNYERLSEPYRKLFLDLIKNEINFTSNEKNSLDDELYKKLEILSGNKNKEKTFKDKEIFIQSYIENLKYILLNKKEIVLFGAGNYGEQVVEFQNWIDADSIKVICDNSKRKQGRFIWGIKIISLKDAVKMYPNAVYIVASKIYANEMKAELMFYGILNEKVFLLNDEDVYGKMFNWVAINK